MTPESEEKLTEQSLAILQIAKDIVRNSRRRDLLLVILLIISILANVFISLIFIGYESQFTTETVETITTTVEQDTGDGGGNNIYQAGENASYIQGDYVEGILDGQATSDNNQNQDSNQDSQE